MYLIIIEGTDNIGKDTLKDQLIDLFDTVTLIHCHSPKSKVFVNYEQDRQFIEYAYNIIDGHYDITKCIIMNRSHYGEYVYGQLYRGRDENSIIKMIDEVDAILSSRGDLTVKYIQLISSSVALRMKNDDEKSLSNMDIEKMKKETDLFCEIYAHSKFDKILINVSDDHDEFRPKEKIYNEVLKFIEQ